jgi:hypothetical protein
MPLPKDPTKAKIARERMRNSHIGKKASVEQRLKMSIAQKGRKHTPETIKKLKVGAKGRRPPKLTSEQIENLRNRMNGDNNPSKRHEIREKISESKKGHMNAMFGTHPTEETRKKLSLSHKGKPLSQEHCINLSRAITGEKSHQWRGGISFEPYCPKFNGEFKERVRLFFGRVCVVCGTPENGKKHCVHHVNFNKSVCCDNTIPLFVPLCRSCHSKTNSNRDYWIQHFTQIINEKHNGRCYLTPDEYFRASVSDTLRTVVREVVK